MNTYKATGKVVEVKDTKTFPSGFTSRDFILDVSEGQYPSPITFTLKKDRVSAADALKPGMTSTVEFTLDGRRWESPNGDVRFFTTLTAWKVTSDAEPTSNEPDALSAEEAAALPF